MFRRRLFLSLTAFLVAVLAWLGVRSYRAEFEHAPNPPGEIIRESKPSMTRVLSPDELQVAQSSMEWLPAASTNTPAAVHSVTIRNTGVVAYRDIVLEFGYEDGGGRPLGTATHKVERAILPGETVILDGIRSSATPPGAARASVRVAYADIGTEPGGKD